MLLSVVSPIYKGEKMLEELVSRISKSVSTITDEYEIILVNDASPDDSWTKIKDLCEKDRRIKGVNLSRNFGQQYSTTAGLTMAKGEWIAVIDCDLQNPPEEIPRLYAKAMEGYDTVFAQRLERQDTFLKKLSSTLFNKVFSYMTDSYQDKSAAEFGLYSRQVIDAVLSMGDAIRYFPVMVKWVGYRIAYLPVQHSTRAEGSSGYTLAKLLSVTSDSMIGFSNKPLRLALHFGTFVTLVAICLAIYYLFDYILNGTDVSGFTTLVISVWAIAGILISLLGVLGLYIGKIFDQVKARPTFIIKDKVNID